MSIKLYIYLPDRVLEEKQADKVILPLQDKTLTLIHGRAPTIQPLVTGPLILLDEHNKISQHYFIDGGFASIENDICRLLTTELAEIEDNNPVIPASLSTSDSARKNRGQAHRHETFELALQNYLKVCR